MTENVQQPLRYMARELDPLTGLYYVRNRRYDPVTHRFVSEDPIGLEGGINTYAYVGNNPTNLRDPLHLLAAGRIKRDQPRRGPAPVVPADLKDPIRTLGLDWPVSMDVLKSRYKELAKRHHPDMNGGDRDSEERLKSINLAYAAVRHYLSGTPTMARAG